MKLLLVMLSVFIMSATYAEMSIKECKQKGYKYDRKKKDCNYDKPHLTGKDKRAYKLVDKAAKSSKYGKQLTVPEKVELAKDLVSYAKKKKVRLKKVKIRFDSTGVQQNTTGEKLEEISTKKGLKLYHINEGSEEVNGSKTIEEVIVETQEKEIEIPTNFFPPNEYEYTSEGREGLINAILDVDEGWHVFNITIVESSASKLANTAGKYDFKSGDSDAEKQNKLLGLALERSNSTEKMLKNSLEGVLVINNKNAIVSGPADVYGTGDTSGEPAPSNIINAHKNLNNSNKKKISEFYNQYQYVKLKVEYMKETKEIKTILEENSKEIPNAEGILAKFSSSTKHKKLKTGKKFKLKFKKRVKKHRYKKPKNRKKKNWGSVKCPKF